MNKIDLSGRRAVVTGGAQGIGRAIAERLLASDASVALWDRDGPSPRPPRPSSGARARSHASRPSTSPTTPRSRRPSTATNKALGGIDILVCNAGIAGPSTKLWEYPIDAWQQVIEIDINGVFYCLQGGRALDDRPELRPDRLDRLDRRQGGQPQGQPLQRRQGRR